MLLNGRNSTGKMDSSSPSPDLERKEKSVPHYMRASTGSCHDRCKYGTVHSSEPKKWRPVRPACRDSANIGHEDSEWSNIVKIRGKPRKMEWSLTASPLKDGSHRKPKVIRTRKLPEKVFHLSDSSVSLELPAEESSPDIVEALPSDPKSPTSIHNVMTYIDGGSLEEPVIIDLEMPLAFQDSDASDEPLYPPGTSHESAEVKFPAPEDSVNDILPAENVMNSTEQSSADHMNENCNISADSIQAELRDEVKTCLLEAPSNESDDLAQAMELPPVNGMSDDLLADNETVAVSKKTVQAEPQAKSSKKSIKSKTKTTLTIENITASSQKRSKAMHRKIADAAVESSNKPKTVRKKAVATGEFSREKKFSLTIASVAPRIKEMKVPSPRNSTNLSGKSASSSRLKASVAKFAVPSISYGNQTERKTKLKNFTKVASQVLQRKGEEKALIPLKLTRSLNLSIKSFSSIKKRVLKTDKPAAIPKNDNKIQRTGNAAADMEEKILYMIEPKEQKNAEVNTKEYRPRKGKVDASKEEKGANRWKLAAVPSTDKMQSPKKLKFRRGKVVSLHPPEHNGPRRLRFRPAKVADENQRIKEAKGRTIRSDNATATDNAISSEAPVVVLRHQDVQDKKNAQGLFNNVIEETASKLVETRKSKVKALVGAFETVISLQESKAASAVAVA